jgi:hypothetical protein
MLISSPSRKDMLLTENLSLLEHISLWIKKEDLFLPV